MDSSILIRDTPDQIRTGVAGSKVLHDWPLHYGGPLSTRPRIWQFLHTLWSCPFYINLWSQKSIDGLNITISKECQTPGRTAYGCMKCGRPRNYKKEMFLVRFNVSGVFISLRTKLVVRHTSIRPDSTRWADTTAGGFDVSKDGALSTVQTFSCRFCSGSIRFTRSA